MVQQAQQKDNPPALGRAVADAETLSVSRQPTHKKRTLSLLRKEQVRVSPSTPNLGFQFLFDSSFVLHFLRQMLNLSNLEEMDPHTDTLSLSPQECE